MDYLHKARRATAVVAVTAVDSISAVLNAKVPRCQPQSVRLDDEGSLLGTQGCCPLCHWPLLHPQRRQLLAVYLYVAHCKSTISFSAQMTS